MSIINKIISWILRSTVTVKSALSQGREVANQVKRITDSPLLDAIVKATATPLDDAGLVAFRKALSSFIVLMGWADLVLQAIDDVDPDAKAVVLTAINAKAAVLVAEAKGATLTIQEALASAPVIYDQNLLD